MTQATGSVRLEASGPDVHHLAATLTCPARHKLRVATYNAADPEPRRWIEQHQTCRARWTQHPAALLARVALLLVLLLWVTWNTAGDMATSSRLTDFVALLAIFTMLATPWKATLNAVRRVWRRKTAEPGPR